MLRKKGLCNGILVLMKLLPIESEGFVEKVARLTEKLKPDSDPPLSHCRNENIKSISVRENVVPVPDLKTMWTLETYSY